MTREVTLNTTGGQRDGSQDHDTSLRSSPTRAAVTLKDRSRPATWGGAAGAQLVGTCSKWPPWNTGTGRQLLTKLNIDPATPPLGMRETETNMSVSAQQHGPQ